MKVSVHTHVSNGKHRCYKHQYNGSVLHEHNYNNIIYIVLIGNIVLDYCIY